MFSSPTRASAPSSDRTLDSLLADSTSTHSVTRGQVHLELVGFVVTDSGELPTSMIYISCTHVVQEAGGAKRYRSSSFTMQERTCGKKVKPAGVDKTGNAVYQCDDGHREFDFMPKFKIECLFEDKNEEVNGDGGESSSSSSSSSSSPSASTQRRRHTCTAMDTGAKALFGVDGYGYASFVVAFTEGGSGTEAAARADRQAFLESFVGRSSRFYCTVDNAVKWTGGVSISLYENKVL